MFVHIEQGNLIKLCYIIKEENGLLLLFDCEWMTAKSIGYIIIFYTFLI